MKKAATTLWFVFTADRSAQLTPDVGEIAATRWLPLIGDEAWEHGAVDPQMRRFAAKLTHLLAV